MRAPTIAVLLAVLAACASAQVPATATATLHVSASADTADVSAVRRAVLDYVEGFYEGDSTKFVRSVRSDVFKYGFWRPRDSTSYQPEQMKWDEFNAYANRMKANKRVTPPTAPKEITIFDVQNMTASAKLTAWWGTDYLLLGKYDGKWMVSSVMWQSPPKQASKGSGE